MTHVDAERHVRGESLFIDDLPVPEGTLHAHVCASDVAHGTLISIEADAAQGDDGGGGGPHRRRHPRRQRDRHRGRR